MTTHKLEEQSNRKCRQQSLEKAKSSVKICLRWRGGFRQIIRTIGSFCTKCKQMKTLEGQAKQVGSKQISVGHLKVISVEINQRHRGWGLKIETYWIQQKCITHDTIGIYKAEEPEIVAGFNTCNT